MKRIRLAMIREHMNDIPQYNLPEGFEIRLFEKGDEKHWSRVETKVDEFESEQAAGKHFTKEFGDHIDDMTERCLFIEDENKDVIATTTAWYGKIEGNNEVLGRIHWVGVIPEYQGKKLSKPLLSAAMNILASRHKAAYLTSQTTSYQAVNMYLNYGFKPLKLYPTCDEAWALMEKTLNRKIMTKETND